jgi:predicted nucleotidyltransferase
LLDFTDRRDLREIAEVVAAVRAAADDLPSMLVGATARDLLLLHAHGIDTVRATNDVDVAVAVPNWDAYRRFRDSLLSTEGFASGRGPHIFFFRGVRVDVIPFGGLERPGRTIAWPPDGGDVMNVLGFSEALHSAVPVRLPEGVETKVVLLPAMAVLKIVAWHDRQYDSPGKDAADLWLLLRNYAEAGNQDLIYTDCITQLEAVSFDQDRAGAWLLGADSLRVMEFGTDREQGIAAVRAILEPEIDPEGSLRLVGQMPFGDKDRQLALLRDFYTGFVASQP